MAGRPMLLPMRRRTLHAGPSDLVFLFRRFVFAQVILGIVCFCMAEKNVGMLLMAGAVGGLSWYVTEGPKGRPLPRWMINIASVLIVGWLIFDLYWQQGHVIIAMGHFTMWLQILLLYTEKSNREYAQMLVLSLLLMIGASVLSVSVFYGVLLAAYCALMLMTLLLFHLKSSSDKVLETNREAAPPGTRVSRPNPLVSRGYRWHFRGTALVVGVICAALAVTTFVVMPRAEPGRAMQHIGQSSAKPTKTGFRNEVDLSRPPASRTNHEPVLNLQLSEDGRPVTRESLALRLRGAALDTYNADAMRWVRSQQMAAFDTTVPIGESGITLAKIEDPGSMLEAEITLRGGQSQTVFTVLPVSHIRAENLAAAQFNPYDQQVQRSESGPVLYTIRWPTAPPKDMVERYRATIDELHRTVLEDPSPFGNMRSRLDPPVGDSSYARNWSVQPRRVRLLARQIIEARGLDRDENARFDKRDPDVAAVLADHLRTQYRYTLDNPETTGEDPTLTFLFDTHKGHCEVFASGLAALARSLGMQARVVTGYLASEYNAVGGYYVVRESDAHAWCEVNLGPYGGWQTFDATPPDDVRAEHSVARDWLTGVRQFYEHLEYTWIRSVVAYDQRTRKAVLNEINASMADIAAGDGGWVRRLGEMVHNLPQLWQMQRFKVVLMGTLLLLLGLALASLIRLLVLRRRRLVALQLHTMPRQSRRGLTRKLRFYLKMLEMLERHGYSRPDWQSPFSFAQELAEANPMRFDPVVALTEIFYEVRFGHRELDGNRRDRVKAHLRQLEHALTSGG